jgi:hypothetical protein
MIPLTDYVSGLTLGEACQKLADHHPFKLTTTTLLPDRWNQVVYDGWIENLGAHALSIYLRTEPNDELYMFHPTKKPHTDQMHLVVVRILEEKITL